LEFNNNIKICKVTAANTSTEFTLTFPITYTARPAVVIGSSDANHIVARKNITTSSATIYRSNKNNASDSFSIIVFGY